MLESVERVAERHSFKFSQVFIRSDVHTLNNPGVYQQDKSGWFNADTEKLTLFERISDIPPFMGVKSPEIFPWRRMLI